MPTVCALSLITKTTIVARQRIFLLDFFFLGYLQRRQSKMAEWGDTSYASYAKNVTIYICVEPASQYELKQKGTAFLCHLGVRCQVRKWGDLSSTLQQAIFLINFRVLISWTVKMSDEMQNNLFVKFGWQLSGIRSDLWTNKQKIFKCWMNIFGSWHIFAAWISAMACDSFPAVIGKLKGSQSI